jgi:hypothetical protein
VSGARRAWAIGAGAAIVAAHALALPALERAFARPDLDVTITGGEVARSWSLAGTTPPELGPRLTVELDDAPLTAAPIGPGLHYLRWTTHYRGGFERRVGAAQLVGPFQDPAHPPCSAHVLVGQRFLDDGHAGPGTVAHAVARELTAQLRGLSQFPIGDFERVSDVHVAWADRAAHPEDLGLVRGDDPRTYARATATIEMHRVSIPISVALIPQLVGEELRFLVRVRAHLDFGNRVFDWVSDKFDGDAFATKLAREQVGAGLISALGPPPPLELPGGHTLRFTYCGQPPLITNGGYASLPLAVAIGDATGAARVLPPLLGPATAAPPPAALGLALELDLDALNALLYELWRTGYLDAELDRVGLHRRFNEDPTVQEFLSIRLSAVRLALPPVVSARATPTGPGLRLAAAAQVTIGDGAQAVERPRARLRRGPGAGDRHRRWPRPARAVVRARARPARALLRRPGRRAARSRRRGPRRADRRVRRDPHVAVRRSPGRRRRRARVADDQGRARLDRRHRPGADQRAHPARPRRRDRGVTITSRGSRRAPGSRPARRRTADRGRGSRR